MASPPDREQPVEMRFVLGSDRAEATKVEERVLAALQRCGYEQAAHFAMRLALQEAIANAVQHGNRRDPSKRVTVCARIDDEAAVVQVQDEGPGFDLDAVPDPTREENLQLPCGRGIVLMRAFMSGVEYLPPGNRVRLTLRRGDAPPAAGGSCAGGEAS